MVYNIERGIEKCIEYRKVLEIMLAHGPPQIMRSCIDADTGTTNVLGGQQIRNAISDIAQPADVGLILCHHFQTIPRRGLSIGNILTGHLGTYTHSFEKAGSQAYLAQHLIVARDRIVTREVPSTDPGLIGMQEKLAAHT
jgi:hypothetical protein